VVAHLALLCATLTLPPVDARAGTLEIADATGRRVSVSVPAARIASLSPSVTEILFAIGAEGALAGVSRHCDYPIAAKLKPKVGDFNQPDLPKIRAAGAELVIFTEQARPADLAALEEARIAALVLPAATVADIAAAVRTLGDITGRATAAAALATELERGIASIRERFAGLPEERRPRVYVEVDGPTALYAVGPGSFMDELVRLAGGRNAFAQRQGAYFPVTSREVVDADPQVVLIDHPFQYKVGVAKREGWAGVAAVRDGRVHDATDFDVILLNRPGPRVLTALRQIIPLLHPGSAP
jgi:iron complex transport system substrate-binding protein